MKTKKISLIIAILTTFCILASNIAFAADQWYICTVDSTGRHFNGNAYIKLTDTNGSFTDKWFIIPSDNTNQYLAVALTALSSGNSVRVYADSSQTYTTVRCLYMQE